MSTIKSSDEHLTLNADGSSKDIKFQANGVEKASISSSGAFTSTTIDATKLTGALPAISGAALTGVGVAGISSSADATAITIDSSEQVGIGVAPSDHTLSIKSVDNTANVLELASGDSQTKLNFSRSGAPTAYVRMYEDGSTGSGALYFGTGTSYSPSDTLKIGSNGLVTMPNQPAFYAYEGASQDSDTIYTVQFTTAATNVGSHYNTSTYRFTAPVAGTYFFSYGWMVSTENNRHHITKNGTVVGENQYSSSTGYSRVEASAVITCAVNDYIEVKNNVGNHATESAMHGSYRYFVGHLIG